MPELPEVEVIRRRLSPLLVGRTIRRVATTRDSYLFLTKPARLRRRLAGRTVEALGRRGKYLVARLDEGSRLVVHLGMTGRFHTTWGEFGGYKHPNALRYECAVMLAWTYRIALTDRCCRHPRPRRGV